MTVAVLSIVGERAHTHIGPWAMVTNKCPKSGVQTPTRKKGGGGSKSLKRNDHNPDDTMAYVVEWPQLHNRMQTDPYRAFVTLGCQVQINL